MISILSFNTLSNAYENKFDNVSESIVDFEYRFPRIIKLITEGNPDVICLQEVNAFSRFKETLDKLGYLTPTVRNDVSDVVIFHRKELKSLFYMRNTYPTVPTKEYEYMLIQKGESSTYEIINLHLKAKPEFSETRCEQLSHLITLVSGDRTIFVGDFNDVPESKCIQLMTKWQYTKFAENGGYTTYKSRGDVIVKRQIDYIFSNDLIRYRLIGDTTSLLPNETHPSDHLGVLAVIKER